MEWIAHQLRKMETGICGFQEVWHAEPLQRACDMSGQFAGAAAGGHATVITYADGKRPMVALASRYPVLEHASIPDFPPAAQLRFEDGAVLPLKHFSRPILRVVLLLPSGDQCTVFVTHIKSKRPVVSNELRHDQKAKAVGHAMSLIVRAAEAAALRCLLVEEMRQNHRPVMLCGDLNDVTHSVTTEIITGTPPWKRLPMYQKEEIWDALLWSTNEVQVRASDRDVTYSHIHNGRYEVLDHVLVSQEFVRSNPGHLGYVMWLQIFNDHLVDETLCDDRRDVTHSDHGQVVAVIRLYARTEPKTLDQLRNSPDAAPHAPPQPESHPQTLATSQPLPANAAPSPKP